MIKKIQTIFLLTKWHFYDKWRIKYLSKRSFKGLQNTTFSIFANNCAAGFIYQDAGLEYRTPTIGLFFHSPCYIKLLKNFNSVNDTLKFVKKSKYESTNNLRGNSNNFYPIAIIGDDIEIHFLHYKSNEDAKDKWARRLSKMNYENLLFLFSAREFVTDEIIREFCGLPFSNKICLSANEYKDLKEVIYFSEYKNLVEIPGADIARVNILQKINFASILNNLKK
jgi:uncharacterized protein (DUF1919 family)